MTEPEPSSPPPAPPHHSASAPSSPLRPSRRIPSPRSPSDSPRGSGSSRLGEGQVRETGLITWIESMREEMRRENEAFRERLRRENEIWRSKVQKELTEEVRKLVVEKYLADHKPSSSSETSSINILEDSPTRPPQVSPLFPLGESSTPTTPAPPVQLRPSISPREMPPPGLGLLPPLNLSSPSHTRASLKPSPGAFILPRKPRIGSYYAAIVDTDGDDPDGALLAHMIEIATYRPGFLYSHTGTPEPHRDCCATLYFATIGNVHDWMHDVNYAYRLDTQELERLQENSGELKRKRRFDAYVRICKVEAEDPWELFERKK
jgi:hypothetical protein